MTSQDALVAESFRACCENVAFTQRFGDRRSQEDCVLADEAQCDGGDRQRRVTQEIDGPLNAARTTGCADPRGRQPPECGGEERDEEHAEPEIRHGVEDERT